jgi:hypothetical protein
LHAAAIELAVFAWALAYLIVFGSVLAFACSLMKAAFA